MDDQYASGAGMSAQPSAAPDESTEQFSVTITANGDGTYSVSSSDSDEAQDDPSAQSDSGAQSAGSVDEALKLAGDMLNEEAGEDSSEPAGGDGNAPVSDPNAVWNALAKKSDAKRM